MVHFLVIRANRTGNSYPNKILSYMVENMAGNKMICCRKSMTGFNTFTYQGGGVNSKMEVAFIRQILCLMLGI